jgi:hypothetical protein
MGAVLFGAGCFVPLDAGYTSVLQWPLIIGGLALTIAPVLLTRRIVADALPLRALAGIGVISYALLIVNEPMRSITHTMRAEHAPMAAVAAWIVLGFIPLTFVLARPLAGWLGLLPRAEATTPIHEITEAQSQDGVIATETQPTAAAPQP